MAKRIKSPRRRSKSFISPTFAEISTGDSNRIPAARFGSYEKYLRAYADETWVYACVNRRSQDVAATPVHLYNKKTGDRIESHDVLAFLANPNPRMGLTGRTLAFIWEASLLLSGNAYWLLDELTQRGVPSIIWPLRSDITEVVPSKDPKVFRDGYLYHAGARPIPFGVAQVKQAQFTNPLDYNYGLPPLSAVRLGVDTHRAATKHNLRFFDNGARPDFIFTTPHSLTDEQRKRMFVSWMRRHRGEDKAHLPAFLEKGTDAKLLGMSPKDSDFINQIKLSREEVCSAFGTPPSVVGLFEYANYATAEEQEQFYQRSTVVPDAKGYCEFLNANVLPYFDRTGGVEFRVDESAIRALQEDETMRAQYVDKYWRMGVPLNSLVDTYKLPFGKQPGGDRVFIAGVLSDPSQVTPEPQPQTEPPAQQEEPLPLKGTKSVPTQEQMKAKHSRFLLLADNLGGPLRVAVRKVFDEQRDRVLRAVEAAGGKPTKDQLGLDSVRSQKELAEAMAPHLKVGVYSGVNAEDAFIRDLGGKTTPKFGRKAENRVDRWVSVNAFKWAGKMNDATLARVDAVIQKSLEDGGGIADVSKALAEVFDTERDYRTLRVAQTEMIASLNQGSLEAYKENETVAGKGWLVTDDEYTRDTHIEAGRKYGDDAGAIPVDDDFKVGSASGPTPGQLGDPAEDINCRCSVFPVVTKEA
jgi:HK97 family phage portal protein